MDKYLINFFFCPHNCDKFGLKRHANPLTLERYNSCKFLFCLHQGMFTPVLFSEVRSNCLFHENQMHGAKQAGIRTVLL